MYHASLREAGMCDTFFVSFISDYRQTFQDVQAFAKISDDHRNEKIRGNAYEGALMYTKYV